MTVQELVDKLKECPLDMEVNTEFEGTFYSVKEVQVTKDDNKKDIVLLW